MATFHRIHPNGVALWRLRPVGAEELLTVDPQYLELSPDVLVDWHRAADLIEHLHSDGADAQLLSDLVPLLLAGDLLDKWLERWVISDRDRYHVMRKTALQTIADSHCTELRTS
jgi:hypothetical protein